jgi:hypothetical protein
LRIIFVIENKSYAERPRCAVALKSAVEEVICLQSDDPGKNSLGISSLLGFMALDSRTPLEVN